MLALLALAGLAAGFVGAVVGGGGLIQLPALLLGLPGASPVQVLGTNKLASWLGVSASASTYLRRVRPDPATFGPLMLAAFTGSLGGAVVAFAIPGEAFDPIVLGALLLVGRGCCCAPHSARRPGCASAAVAMPGSPSAPV